MSFKIGDTVKLIRDYCGHSVGDVGSVVNVNITGDEIKVFMPKLGSNAY